MPPPESKAKDENKKAHVNPYPSKSGEEGGEDRELEAGIFILNSLLVGRDPLSLAFCTWAVSPAGRVQPSGAVTAWVTVDKAPQGLL